MFTSCAYEFLALDICKNFKKDKMTILNETENKMFDNLFKVTWIYLY